MCDLFFSLSETDAHKSATPITDHDSDRKCYNGQWEHDRIGSITVRAQIAGICNEDLINNIVKSTDQKRNDTGNCVLLHQLADLFSPQILI